MDKHFSDAFERDGFAVLPQVLSAEQLGRLRATVQDSVDPPLAPIEFEADVAYPGSPESQLAVGGQTPRRLLHAYGRDAVFRALARDPAIVSVLGQLLGGDGVFVSQNHHNCVMTKMPGFSSETQWHQDIRYWRFDRPELISVWVALGDERVANGALRMIPGSHRTAFDPGRLDAKLFLRQDLAENRALIESAVDCELAAGDVVLFHCRTFHAAGRNTTDAPKLACVFTYHGADNHPIPGTRSSRFPSIRVD
ncbi:MAG: phytanoyl-CoA dioxygenase family protein [Pseudomonadota bacterium]